MNVLQKFEQIEEVDMPLQKIIIIIIMIQRLSQGLSFTIPLLFGMYQFFKQKCRNSDRPKKLEKLLFNKLGDINLTALILEDVMYLEAIESVFITPGLERYRDLLTEKVPNYVFFLGVNQFGNPKCRYCFKFDSGVRVMGGEMVFEVSRNSKGNLEMVNPSGFRGCVILEFDKYYNSFSTTYPRPEKYVRMTSMDKAEQKLINFVGLLLLPLLEF